jgi:glycosyltransferase involved in cell wall biosynthesis
MAQVKKCRPGIRLYIIGEGPDRKKLEKKIRSLGLNKHGHPHRKQGQSFSHHGQDDGFALTSRYEGRAGDMGGKDPGLEIFITKNLEKYNPGIAGREDIVRALCGAAEGKRQATTSPNIIKTLKRDSRGFGILIFNIGVISRPLPRDGA